MKALGIDGGDESCSDEDDEEFAEDRCEGDSIEDDDERGDIEEHEDAVDGGCSGLEATVDDYLDKPEDLFSASKLQELKNKERTLIERRENGYCRSKEHHKHA